MVVGCRVDIKWGRSLADLVKDQFLAFPSSGETNFLVKDAHASISRVLALMALMLYR